MSADNTIAILKTRGPEFRVAMIFNSEDLDIDELQRWFKNPSLALQAEIALRFRDARVFQDEDDAEKYAIELEKEIGYVEYGIGYFTFLWMDFPGMSKKEIDKILDDTIPYKDDLPGKLPNGI